MSYIFLVLAVVLSDIMCAVTAYNYRSMELCVECSAPPYVALLLAIPYGLAIVLCLALAWFFRRKANKA
ncbi:MAG: hypothetical protein NC319_01595 [Butyricicoccus sp.]|nr:hypothetical protein [Butyricicoccus sp.]